APAPPRLPGAPLRGDGLLRVLVRPRARGPPALHGRGAARRHRDRAAPAVQGQRHRRRSPLPPLPLPPGHRHVRGGLGLPAEGRRGLHPAERPAAPHSRPPGSGTERLVSGVIDVALTLEELSRTSLAGVTAVMIDALRASTTIVTALANGA